MDPVGESMAPPEMNGRQWLVVIVMDVLVISELFIGMYMASAQPDDFTVIFLKAFFGMLIPTLVIGVWVKRHFRNRAAPA